MDQHKLDKYLKDRFDGYRESVDKDELWANLTLDKKKNKRRLIFFIFGSMLTLIFIGAICWFIFGGEIKDSTTIVSNNISEEKIREEQIAAEVLKSRVDQENKFIESIAEISQKAFESFSEYKKTNVSRSKAKLQSAQFFERNQNVIANSDGASITSEITTNKFLESDLSRKSIEALETEIIAEASLLKKEASVSPLTSCPRIDLFGRENILLSLNDPYELKREPTRSWPIEPNSSGHWFFNFRTSYTHLHRDLKAINPLQDNVKDYIEKREASEFMNEALNLGFALGYQFKSGFYLKFGLEGQSYNEQFQVRYTNDSLDTAGLVLEYQSDTIQTFSGENLSNAIVSERWNNSNNNFFINLPLTLGYKFHLSKFNVLGELSPYLSKHIRFNGLMLSGKNEITSSPDLFNSFGVGLGASFGIEYNYTEKASLLVMSNYQTTLRSVTKASSGMIQKYRLLGISIGLNCRL